MRALIFSCLCALAFPALATIEFTGVFTQNFIHTSDNNFGGESDDSLAMQSTEASLLANISVTDDLNLSGQAMYRHFGESDEGLDIDFLMLDFHPIDRERWMAGLQLGRFKNALGFYGKTRDIAPTRDSIVLPQSIYYEGWRELQLSTDGLNLYGVVFTQQGELIMELGYGKPRAAAFQESEALGKPSNERALIYSILYEHKGGQWRFGLSGSDTEFDQSYTEFDPFIGFLFEDQGHNNYSNLIYSVEYNGPLWSITAEFARGEFKDAYQSGFSSRAIDESAYLQLRRHFSARLDGFIRYDQYYPDIADKDGASFEESHGGFKHLGYSRNYSAGFKWKYSQALDFRAEFHRTHGTATLPAEDNDQLEALREAWNMVAVSFSYQF